jgi:TRAP-type C4-dicarboxylate transport system substrate-binding protein
MIQRRSIAGLAVAMVLGVGACSPAASPLIDKAGGVSPVILRLGTGESEGNPIVPVLRRFADSVATRTDGRVTVEIQFYGSAGLTDFEQAMIDRVRDRTVDLGVISTRGWVDGALALRALQAPFVIDSYPLLKAVLSSPASETLLAGVDKAGFTGLGLFPGQLRHPMGFRRPIVSATDFEGLRIRTVTSPVSDPLAEALGATPVHLVGDALQEAIQDGDLDAADTSVGNAAMYPSSSIVTANIILYPLVGMFFADSTRFASLEREVQDALRGAAADAAAFAWEGDLETADVQAFCLTGGTFALASDATLDELATKARGLIADLRADPQTAAMIDQITALKAELAASPSVPSCPTGDAAPVSRLVVSAFTEGPWSGGAPEPTFQPPVHSAA